MGKVDVIQAIFESFELIKLHYKEVAVPLVVLLLFAAAGSSGGSSFSDRYNRSSSSSSSSLSDSMFANALNDTSMLALGGLLLVIVAVVIFLALLLSILDRAVWFYVYEHFYALLLKKKISADWKTRMKKHSVKAAILLVFWLVAIVVLFALPALQLWSAISTLTSLTFEGVLGALLSGIALLLVAVFLILLLGFLLTPLWIFYAMDGCGLTESIAKAISLVVGNLGTFIVFGFIFTLLWFGELMAGVAACCFSFLVSPLLSVFFGLLWGVTLMKIKLALEKK